MTTGGAGEAGSAGPLTGLRFVEMAGIGPVPFAAMVLADLGATGVRIESPRPGLGLGDPTRDITRRGRDAVVVDVRDELGRALVVDLIDSADLLLEGFRPGVMERLGLGPDDCLARNPALVFGRMTGWGQDGPWARTAGHDLDYIALAGALAHIGRAGQPPTPPLNLLADYGGGAMLLLVGVLAALWEAQRSGRGQVVDAAMVDGVALLMSLFHSMTAQGMWREEAGVNLLDSGAPFYDVYPTSDGRWLAVACLEPQFYAEWLRVAGLDGEALPAQYDVAGWPVLRERFSAAIASRTRDEWAEAAAATDACVAPVLTMQEAAAHPHLSARGTFVEIDGITQSSPAPRFSRTPTGAPGSIGAASSQALTAWGVEPGRVDDLRARGIVG